MDEYFFPFNGHILESYAHQTLPAETFRAWVNLLCVANLPGNKGKLRESIEDIAWRLRKTPEETNAILDELKAVGIVELDEEEDALRIYSG